MNVVNVICVCAVSKNEKEIAYIIITKHGVDRDRMHQKITIEDQT